MPRPTGVLRRSATIAAAALTLAGCASGSGRHATVAAAPEVSSVSPAAGRATTAGSPAGGGGGPATDASAPSSAGASGTAHRVAHPTKLLVVVLENSAARTALAGMPYLASQAHRYGLATRSVAATHPSLPNYLAITGGSTFGVHDDASPARHPLQGPSVFGQVIAAHRTARTYAEGMPSPCAPAPFGDYAVKHNPWAYFVDERAQCKAFDVPMGSVTSGALHDDVAAGRLPTLGLAIPDLCHDAHNCSLRTADTWLRGWLHAVEAGPDFRSGRLAVVVTFDEDDGSAGNAVLTVVLHRSLHAAVVTARLTHYAVSAAASGLVGARPLRSAATAPDLLRAFGLA